MLQRFAYLVSLSPPNACGTMQNVLEIPSLQTSYESFATELSDARAPLLSLPCIGFAPGANGSPARLPSGVLPVFFPYTTFDVMVSIESVCSAFL